MFFKILFILFLLVCGLLANGMYKHFTRELDNYKILYPAGVSVVTFLIIAGFWLFSWAGFLSLSITLIQSLFA